MNLQHERISLLRERLKLERVAGPVRAPKPRVRR
jgi:hypothetical protein